MKKVLIVDDELLVRVGLKSTIRWEENGYKIVGDARNGKEALDLFDKYGADIIITDISMPLIDGMELIKILKSKQDSLKFIILSHHDDFKFAQEAIELGVIKYILKHELTESSLLNILAKLNGEEENEQEPDRCIGENEALSYRDHLYRWLAEDNISENLKNEIIERPEFSLLKRDFFVVCIHIDFKNDFPKGTEEQCLHHQRIIDHVVREASNENNMSMILLAKDDEMLYIVKEMSNQEEKLKEFMLTVKRNVKRIMDLKLAIGISEIGNSYEFLHEAYKQAKWAQVNSDTESDGIMIFKRANEDELTFSRKQYSIHVRKMVHFLEENYHRNISLTDVADLLQMNKSYVSMLFKQETGVNFSFYLTRIRIEKAKELLMSTEKKIYEIAEEIGFESPYYFSTLFKEFTKVSCKEFRDKYYNL